VLLHVLDKRKNGMRNDLTKLTSDGQNGIWNVSAIINLSPKIETSFQVRVGIPHEEILAEATETSVRFDSSPDFQPVDLEKIGRHYLWRDSPKPGRMRALPGFRHRCPNAF